MKRLIASVLLLLYVLAAHAQSSIVTRWLRNTTGKKGSYYYNNGGMPPTYTWTVSADSADVLSVAYTTDSVWVRSNGLTDSMGKYLNPGSCLAQGYVHRFPRKTAVPATKTISPKGGAIGLLLNGVPIYGLSNSASYKTSTASNANDGAGVWNVEVGKSEGFVLDTNYGAHPQQQGAYHTHDKPYRMYRDSGTTKHSPLIGYAFDGYPVYGPYAYASPLNAASGITRMKSGYSLRNITTRTTLPAIPNGGGAASQTGPAVNTTFPLGTYIEDYEWLAANGGDLDQYNGRFCVTPEYPGGTYAYFVTIDATLNAAFPYYIGVYYYGQPVTANAPTVPGSLSNGLTIPATATAYRGGVPLPLRLLDFSGSRAGPANRLGWTIAAGEAPESMVLERSIDGRDFEPIASVLSRYGSGRAQAYSHTDAQPPVVSYYRLHLRGAGGSATYSAVVALQQAHTGPIVVYPTLARQNLYVQVPESEGPLPALQVWDAMGRPCGAGTWWDGRRCRLDIAALPAGSYLLRVAGSQAVQTFRFMKQ